MKIVYHCFGGTHSSVLSASLHTGILPFSGPPAGERLFKLPLFDTQDGVDQGKLYFYGFDENGNQVYVIGRNRDMEALYLIFCGAGNGEAADGVLLVNALPCVPFLLRIGGFISRRLKLPRLGRPLLRAGLRQGYRCVSDLVYRVKAEIAAV